MAWLHVLRWAYSSCRYCLYFAEYSLRRIRQRIRYRAHKKSMNERYAIPYSCAASGRAGCNEFLAFCDNDGKCHCCGNGSTTCPDQLHFGVLTSQCLPSDMDVGESAGMHLPVSNQLIDTVCSFALSCVLPLRSTVLLSRAYLPSLPNEPAWKL